MMQRKMLDGRHGEIDRIIDGGHGSEDIMSERRDLLQKVEMLERTFSDQEIQDAVWACGCDKAPGPDEFSFHFLRRFWDQFKTEVIAFVQEFYVSRHITPGCNSSFITLIPKCENPTLIKDFRRISLIGLQYKIISKLLADRLVKVVD
nr:transposon TX1 putative 149 kDa protein [Tanacetum cinerariifolium]